MNKKKHTHSCRLNGISGETEKTGSTMSRRKEKKTVKDIFDRYYKNQIAALYRAVQE